ncbi:chemocyanin-like [Triticum dicoccoides]|uniref:Phytocyanin domain-containing protein n=1 Tax=Triticum turgidum subsp. durum TaxID=4567 RepID=A0A9R1NWA8_TRITD|nr:chemocyanin-like [Triticum dicoccoides]VAH32343.1 unnamed protein product [Triticum turgidum subsp. durum]
MARGSSSGKLAEHGLLLVFLMLLQGGVEQAAARPREWYVGDQKGWTFGVMGWPNSPTFKPFREGDVLVFKYDRAAQNVIQVDDFGFGTCTRHPANATVYDSGNDRIRLSRGLINFISGVSDNCYKGGVKISLTVRP